ncbi:HAD-like protein [Xylaria curta]|nr:HAD-like protein [Xylaria curta]
MGTCLLVTSRDLGICAFPQGLAPEDIDGRTLLKILRDPQRADHEHRHLFFGDGGGTAIATSTGTDTEALPPDGEDSGWPIVEEAVRSWYHMTAWDDLLPALEALNKVLGLELFVELLGVYKPALEAYEKALALVGVRPEQAVMAAAHAYDLGAANVYRWTDDTTEDVDLVRRENESFLDEGGMSSPVDAIRAW